MEKVIGVPPPELFSLHPLQSLYDACHLLVESRAHRLPLVDVDSETGEEMIVSVLTQYRILKFIAMNVSGTIRLLCVLLDCRFSGELVYFSVGH